MVKPLAPSGFEWVEVDRKIQNVSSVSPHQNFSEHDLADSKSERSHDFPRGDPLNIFSPSVSSIQLPSSVSSTTHLFHHFRFTIQISTTLPIPIPPQQFKPQLLYSTTPLPSSNSILNHPTQPLHPSSVIQIYTHSASAFQILTTLPIPTPSQQFKLQLY